MRRRIMETCKPGRVTNVANADGEEQAQVQVSPIDPLIGELLVANILGDSIGAPVRPEKETRRKNRCEVQLFVL
jgi:hypothetical protein